MKEKAVHVGAMKSAGHERDANEWYVDEPFCTDLLLEQEEFHGRIWDPCCGLGTIVRRLRAHGHDVLATDLIRRGYEDISGIDFLTDTVPCDTPANVVFNMPYGGGRERAKLLKVTTVAQAFVNRALDLATGKVCALLPLTFLASAARHDWWQETAPARIWVLSTRPSMPPGSELLAGTIKAKGGKADYCWVVWANDEPRRAQPQLGWLGLPEGDLKKRRDAYPEGWWA